MHYLTLDTNTWIYLANGTEPVRLLHFIKREVEKGNITILLPEIVLQEWEVHKEKTVRKGGIKHFNDIKNAFEQILKLLGDKGERNLLSFLLDEKDNREYFKDFLDKFKLREKEIDDAITDNIMLVDNLFKNYATLIKIKDEIYIKAGTFALYKKAPFKLKNSFADALIVFSFLQYVKSNRLEGAMFISYNTDDFCEKKNGKKYLHPDLQPEFQNANSSFYKIVGEAINTIERNIVSEEELAIIEGIQNDKSWSNEPEFCEVCQENNGRFNAVYFEKSFDLIDERLSVSANSKEKKYDFSENTIQPLTDSPVTTIEVGFCDWCSTQHFKCINCRTTNCVWDGEYNKRKECEGCGLNYIIKREYNRDGNEETEFIIPKDTVTCQKCGGEFDKEDIIEEICMNCEDEYNYGEK